jgi:sulfate adenylyltransferase
MRMAGPREALWHAIIRRNHGANHFIVGRDHAGPGNNSQGKPFFAPYEAQALAKQYEKELGITIVPFNEFVYLPEEHCYEDRAKLSPDKKFWTISGTQVREEYLDKAKPLPSWFTREECAQILAKAYPPKNQRGLCIWFTGLPCAGKTTHAEILAAKLRQAGKAVTFCDGDVMRKFLATGLGFSLEDRETYLRRLGYIAAEIVRHQGIIIVAAVSPLKHSRRYVREEINKSIGNFVEVFIDTPIEVCSRRDIKGMYAKAKRGEIPNFTGISSPYETPENPEIRLTTENISQEENVKTILQYLQEHDDLSLSCHIAPQVFV